MVAWVHNTIFSVDHPFEFDSSNSQVTTTPKMAHQAAFNFESISISPAIADFAEC